MENHQQFLQQKVIEEYKKENENLRNECDEAKFEIKILKYENEMLRKIYCKNAKEKTINLALKYIDEYYENLNKNTHNTN